MSFQSQAPPTSRSWRLFVALPLPPHFPARLAPPADLPRGLRWTRPGQMHLTLRFIGEVPAPAVEAIGNALAEIRAAAFTAATTGTGCFPNARAPRVLWLGLEPHPALLALQRQVEECVVECGIVAADKPFVPHITLARLQSAPRGVVMQVLQKYADLDGVELAFNEFRLYASHLEQRGARHELLASYALKTTPGPAL